VADGLGRADGRGPSSYADGDAGDPGPPAPASRGGCGSAGWPGPSPRGSPRIGDRRGQGARRLSEGARLGRAVAAHADVGAVFEVFPAFVCPSLTHARLRSLARERRRWGCRHPRGANASPSLDATRAASRRCAGPAPVDRRGRRSPHAAGRAEAARAATPLVYGKAAGKLEVLPVAPLAHRA
jgi:hypothetical protein